MRAGTSAQQTTPLAVLQADMINGTKLLGQAGQMGELKPGYYADVIAVPGNPLNDISGVEHVRFVKKWGKAVRQDESSCLTLYGRV